MGSDSDSDESQKEVRRLISEKEKEEKKRAASSSLTHVVRTVSLFNELVQEPDH